jgi:hypothetical protein
MKESTPDPVTEPVRIEKTLKASKRRLLPALLNN